MPVLMGSATGGHGVTRLLKALRHESPGIAHTRKRLQIEDKGPALAQAVRTIHTAHGGKLSLARVLRGAFADGATVINSRGVEERIGGLARLMGAVSSKVARAEEGDTIAFARLESLATGDRFSDGRIRRRPPRFPPLRLRPKAPLFASRTERTRSGSRAPSPSFAKRIARSPSCRTPRCPN